MKIYIIVTHCLVLQLLRLNIHWAVNSQNRKASRKQLPKINGIGFVASPRKTTETMVFQVKQTNAQWVSLMPFAFLKTISLPGIQYNQQRQLRGERVEGIKETALLFKKVE